MIHHGAVPSTGARATGTTAAALLFAMSAALVGCSADDGASDPKATGTPQHPSASAGGAPAATRSLSGTAGTPAPSGSPSDRVHTLAELSRHPCLAVDDADSGPTGLYIVIEGREAHYKNTPTSCQWGARGGLVGFTPHTTADLTRDARYKNLTPKRIAGHRALLGTSGTHGDSATTALVSAGPGRSFTVTVAPFGEGAPGPDGPTLVTRFAKAILGHLD